MVGDAQTSSWTEMTKPEMDRAWDRFYPEFAFRPSPYPKDFPGIREPSPSRTYALPRDAGSSLSDGQTGRLMLSSADGDMLHDRFLAAFRACTPSGGRLAVLDWNHNCHWFAPHTEPHAWRTSVVPDGDYYIFLAEDFSWGTFGHPWEWTICVFGEPLLAALGESITKILGAPIRQR